MKKTDETHMASTIRIRENRWKEIEKMAWKLSMETKTIVKPTDVVDAILFKATKQITMKDIEEAKENR